MIISEALSYEKIAEDPAQIGIFRVVVKAKGTDVIEISCELSRKAPAQILCIDRLLLLQDRLPLLRIIRRFKTLPRERAPKEVEKHIS